MATNKDLTWRLGVTDNASNVFGQVGNAAESMSSKVGDSISKIGGAIGGELGDLLDKGGEAFTKFGEAGSTAAGKMAAAGAGIAGLGVALGVFGSGDKAAEQQLDAAVTATGQSVDDYGKQIDAAKSKAEDFGHSGADAELALAQLTESTGDVSIALAQMTLVENLAAAKHESLADAATQVAAIFGGNTKILKQYGIDLKVTAGNTSEATAATGALGDKLAGQASANSDTFMGKIDALKEHVTDFAGRIGNDVSPTLTFFGTGLGLVSGAMEILAARAEKSAAAELELAAASEKEAGAATESAVASEAQATAQAKLGESAGSSKLALAGAAGAFTGVMAATVFGGNALSNYLDKNKLAMGLIDGTAKSLGTLTQAFQADGNAVGDQTKSVVQSQLESSGLAAKAAQAGISLTQLTAATSGSKQEFSALVDEWKASGNPSSSTLTSLISLYVATHNLTPATKDQADAMAYATITTLGLGTALDTTSSFFSDGANAANRLTNAIKDATSNVLDATNKQLAYEDSVQAVSDSFKTNGITLNQNTTASRANTEAVLASIGNLNSSVALWESQGMSTADMTTKLSQNEAQLVATGGSSKTAQAQIQQMINTMVTTPKQIGSQIIIDASQALNAIDTVAGKLGYLAGLEKSDLGTYNSLIGSFNQFTLGAIKGGYGTGGIPGEASGGDAPLAWVGEYGPELLDTRTGRVTPHGQSMQMARSGASGGGTVNHFNIDVNMPASSLISPSSEIGRAVAAHLTMYLNMGGSIGSSPRQAFSRP